MFFLLCYNIPFTYLNREGEKKRSADRDKVIDTRNRLADGALDGLHIYIYDEKS